jgi:hypothetical protein
LSAGHFLTITDISSAHFAAVYIQSADFVAADMSPPDFTAAAVDAPVAVTGRSESERQNARQVLTEPLVRYGQIGLESLIPSA